MKLFFRFLGHKKRILFLFAGFFILLTGSFFLYRLPFSAVIYPILLCFLLGCVFLIVAFYNEKRRHEQLLLVKSASSGWMDDLPEASSIPEEDYRELMQMLCDLQKKESELSAAKYQDMVNYYTLWAHQIKTPIASMKLSIQNEDSDFSRKLRIELGRVEAYVEMVLTYMRLESNSTDYVFRECSLDAVIKPVIRKFAGDFIGKKLKLCYDAIDTVVITDEKWLGFVIEQVLSNAVKYTEKGSISVFLDPDRSLCIRDTGIGIAPGDLPRIFEKGYTGFNGRTDRRSSGIGLHLCKRVCDNLGLGISAESEPGNGTTLRIRFPSRQIIVS